MARKSLYDSMINKNQMGYFDKRLDSKPTGGMTRETDPGGDTGTPEIPGTDYGQQQWGPEMQSGLGGYLDYQGSIGSAAGYDQSLFGWYGINNQSDLYDWWTEYQNFPVAGGGQYDTFYDWLQSQNEGYYGGYYESPQASGHATGWNNSIDTTLDPAGYVGGPRGAGDLGTGNVFIGGGMGSSIYGEGLQGQDCMNIGPQFNSSGECIACCSEQYAHAGFYGHGGDPAETDVGMLDEPENPDCNSLYAQSGGFDMTQLSYTEFESMYC